jgi:hypothetical protein
VVARFVMLLPLVGCDQLWKLEHVDEKQVDATLPDSPLDCPTTYTFQSRVSQSRYRFVPSNAAWVDAQAMCVDEAEGRTHLVVLTDESERLDLLDLLAQDGIVNNAWIGLSDRRIEGFFLWVTDEPVGMPPATMPPWGEFQPDDSGGNQDCARIEGPTHADPGYFDDSSCAQLYPFVCECDGVAPEPMNY